MGFKEKNMPEATPEIQEIVNQPKIFSFWDMRPQTLAKKIGGEVECNNGFVSSIHRGLLEIEYPSTWTKDANLCFPNGGTMSLEGAIVKEDKDGLTFVRRTSFLKDENLEYGRILYRGKDEFFPDDEAVKIPEEIIKLGEIARENAARNLTNGHGERVRFPEDIDKDPESFVL